MSTYLLDLRERYLYEVFFSSGFSRAISGVSTNYGSQLTVYLLKTLIAHVVTMNYTSVIISQCQLLLAMA